MATISSAGIGSGLDINSLVTQLVAAESQMVDLKSLHDQAVGAKLDLLALPVSDNGRNVSLGHDSLPGLYGFQTRAGRGGGWPSVRTCLQ